MISVYCDFSVLINSNSCIFGILIKDIHTIIPNSLGLIFAAINSSIWAYFYCKRDKNDDEDEKREVITPEKEEI